MSIEPGLKAEITITVQESDTARFSAGEGFPPVLSTPRLIGYLERTAHQALLPHLKENQGSVGSCVNIRHLAATPVGMQVRFCAELMEVDGRRLRFKVEAWDEVEKIAEGEHERFLIDRNRFDERLAEKTLRVRK
jgi:predicted thioesterase|uniref:Thioesterase n=1 Tax=Bellilinea caldifistulae TaxID=360411 RepID=A0A7C4Q3B2_9CHLR